MKKIEMKKKEMDIRKLNIDYRGDSEIELDMEKAHILLKELKHIMKIDDYYRTHFNENQLNHLLNFCFTIVQKAIDIFPDENYKEIIRLCNSYIAYDLMTDFLKNRNENEKETTTVPSR